MLPGHSDSFSSILGRWYRGYLKNVRQTTSTSGPLRYAQLAGTFKVRIPTNTQHAETLQHVLSQCQTHYYPDSNDNGTKMKGKTSFCREESTLCYAIPPDKDINNIQYNIIFPPKYNR